jgi:hypothetical protein
MKKSKNMKTKSSFEIIIEIKVDCNYIIQQIFSIKLNKQ